MQVRCRRGAHAGALMAKMNCCGLKIPRLTKGQRKQGKTKGKTASHCIQEMLRSRPLRDTQLNQKGTVLKCISWSRNKQTNTLSLCPILRPEAVTVGCQKQPWKTGQCQRPFHPGANRPQAGRLLKPLVLLEPPCSWPEGAGSTYILSLNRVWKPIQTHFGATDAIAF